MPKYLETLFDLQEDQFEDGARNFLFIDVPPVHRSPSGMQLSSSCSGVQLKPRRRTERTYTSCRREALRSFGALEQGASPESRGVRLKA